MISTPVFILNRRENKLDVPYSWSYRQAIANGLKAPKEIDDFAFEINFIRENYVALND